jgi:CRP-like cAMP-binding protein
MEHLRVEGLVLRQGDRNTTHAFVVLRGRCHVYRRTTGGDGGGAGLADEGGAVEDLGELHDADVTAGDVFGEVACLAGAWDSVTSLCASTTPLFGRSFTGATEVEAGTSARARAGIGDEGDAAAARNVRQRNASVVTAPVLAGPAVDLLAIDGGALRAMTLATPTVLFQPKALRRLLAVHPGRRTPADIADIVNFSRWLAPLRGVPEALLAPLAAAAEGRHVPIGGTLSNGHNDGDGGSGSGGGGDARDSGSSRGSRWSALSETSPSPNRRRWTPGEEMAVVVSGRLVVHDGTPASYVPADVVEADSGLQVAVGVKTDVCTFREDTSRAISFRGECTDPVVGDAMLSGIPGGGGGGKRGFAYWAKAVKLLAIKANKARQLSYSGQLGKGEGGAGLGPDGISEASVFSLGANYRISSIRHSEPRRSFCGLSEESGGGGPVDIGEVATLAGRAVRLSIKDIVLPPSPDFGLGAPDVSDRWCGEIDAAAGAAAVDVKPLEEAETTAGVKTAAEVKLVVARNTLHIKRASTGRVRRNSLVIKTASMGRMAALLGQGRDGDPFSSIVHRNLDLPPCKTLSLTSSPDTGPGHRTDDGSDDENVVHQYGRVTVTLRPGDAYGESDLVKSITGSEGISRGESLGQNGGRITLRACGGRAAAADRCPGAGPGSGLGVSVPSRAAGADVMVVSKAAYDEAVRRVQSGVMEEAVDFLRRVGGGASARAPNPAANLAGYGPLGSCTETELSRMVFLARAVTAEKGSVLVQEGSPPDGIYFVIRGQLRVTRRRGVCASVATMIPPSVLGQHHVPRPGSPPLGGGSCGMTGRGGGIVPGASSPRAKAPMHALESQGASPPSPSFLGAAASAAAAAARAPLHISADRGRGGYLATDKHLAHQHEVGVMGPADFFGAETVPDVGAGVKGTSLEHSQGLGGILGLLPAAGTVSVSSSAGCELLLLSWRDLPCLSRETQAAIRTHVVQRGTWWRQRTEELAAKLPPKERVATWAAGMAAAAKVEANAAAHAAAEVAADPAQHVVMFDPRPSAKASFFASPHMRTSFSFCPAHVPPGRGIVAPFGVDGLGGYYGRATHQHPSSTRVVPAHGLNNCSRHYLQRSQTLNLTSHNPYNSIASTPNPNKPYTLNPKS